MKTLTIQTNTKEDRDALMGVLYSYGAVFHQSVSPGLYSLKDANAAFTDMLILRLEFLGGKLDICGMGSLVTKFDVNFSTDTGRAIALIKEYIKEVTKPIEPVSILVKDVGDYEAEVKEDGIHIYGQVISFEKFDEIAAAFQKLND